MHGVALLLYGVVTSDSVYIDCKGDRSHCLVWLIVIGHTSPEAGHVSSGKGKDSTQIACYQLYLADIYLGDTAFWLSCKI